MKNSETALHKDVSKVWQTEEDDGMYGASEKSIRAKNIEFLLLANHNSEKVKTVF